MDQGKNPKVYLPICLLASESVWLPGIDKGLIDVKIMLSREGVVCWWNGPV